MLKFFFRGMSFGKWLRARRKHRGLSQERLAELITAHGHKVSSGSVSNIEREYDRTVDGLPTKPRRAFVEIAAIVLDEDPNEALLLAGYSPKDDQVTPNGFFKGIERLTPERQELARRQIRAIIDSLAEEEDFNTDYIDDEE